MKRWSGKWGWVFSPKYSNVTYYVSTFEGQLGDIQRLSPDSWSMKLKALTTESPADQTWIEDGIRYIASAPY